jgi:hypothetical protein
MNPANVTRVTEFECRGPCRHEWTVLSPPYSYTISERCPRCEGPGRVLRSTLSTGYMDTESGPGWMTLVAHLPSGKVPAGRAAYDHVGYVLYVTRPHEESL